MTYTRCVSMTRQRGTPASPFTPLQWSCGVLARVEPIPESAAAPIKVLHLARAQAVWQRRGPLLRVAWLLLETLILNNRLVTFSGVRVALLRAFGARIGQRCRLLQPLRVKSPWLLEMGNDCWLGESVWICNQDRVSIGSNVCLSQGVFLTTGSHDVRATMDLQVSPIVIEDGAWISAMCVVQRGITVGRSAVVTPLSVVHKSLAPGGIYGGNPCRFVRSRF